MKFPWYQAIYVQILIQVRSNIYDESQKLICWSFNYDCSGLVTTTSLQRKADFLTNF